jgi:hypothetical protein
MEPPHLVRWTPDRTHEQVADLRIRIEHYHLSSTVVSTEPPIENANRRR